MCDHEIVNKKYNGYVVRNVSNKNVLSRTYLPSEMTLAQGKSTGNQQEVQIEKQNRVQRRLQREPALQLHESVRRRFAVRQPRRQAPTIVQQIMSPSQRTTRSTAVSRSPVNIWKQGIQPRTRSRRS